MNNDKNHAQKHQIFILIVLNQIVCVFQQTLFKSKQIHN
jgi:hypothetical protein